MTDTNRTPDSETQPDADAKAARDARHYGDARSDMEQVVEARSDAVARGEGGEEPSTLTDSGVPDGVGGTGGVTKNQDDDAQ